MSQAPKFTTLGCRLNAYETEAMKELAGQAGLGNAVIVNTCAVTSEAVRKARQEIRRLRRENPEARLIVTGCAAQTEPETFAAMPEVDAVIGNTEKMAADTWARLAGDFIGETERVLVDDIMSVRETAGHLIDGFGSRSRAYVQVQNGCDHRCTFCIIPYGRGNSRSVPAGVVVEQIKRLVGAGYNEVVLTGVDLTSWGADLPAAPKLGDLVMRILRLVPDLPRLRISSIDSIEVDENLMQAIATEPRLMPHLHLSLQHGDDLILKRMKRRHLRDDAIRFAEEARRLRPARMPQVKGPAIKARAARLRAAGEGRVAAHLAAQQGREHAVLMEAPRMGRTEQFTEVVFDRDHPEGQIVRARVTGWQGGQLTAA